MFGVNKAFLTVGGVFWGTQGRHAVRNLAGSGDERRGAQACVPHRTNRKGCGEFLAGNISTATRHFVTQRLVRRLLAVCTKLNTLDRKPAGVERACV